MFVSLFAWLSELYHTFAEATKGSPFLAGGVAVWALTISSYLLRSVPRNLWHLISTQSTTSITLNNTGYEGNLTLFHAFMDWYGKTGWVRFSRTLSLDAKTYNGSSCVVGPGYGRHFFIHGGYLYWFQKGTLDSAGSERQKEVITIHTIGRSTARLTNMVKEFIPKRERDNRTTIYVPNGENDWTNIADIVKRPFDSVILDKKVKDTLVARLDDFYTKREWYVNRGLDHKLCIVLHGPPGTGKTSIVKSLAGKYDADLYNLNITEMTDKSLRNAIASVRPGSFVLLEDFDASTAVKSRKTQATPNVGMISDSPVDVSKPPKPAAPPAPLTLPQLDNMMLEGFSLLSISGVLNALDGVVGLDNIVVIMTTNHLEKIDSAILRKGRVNLIIEIGLLSDESVKEYINYSYGEQDFTGITFKPVAGCELQDALLVNKDSYEGFIKTLAPFIE